MIFLCSGCDTVFESQNSPVIFQGFKICTKCSLQLDKEMQEVEQNFAALLILGQCCKCGSFAQKDESIKCVNSLEQGFRCSCGEWWIQEFVQEI